MWLLPFAAAARLIGDADRRHFTVTRMAITTLLTAMRQPSFSAVPPLACAGQHGREVRNAVYEIFVDL
jgi:hypothetical protein